MSRPGRRVRTAQVVSADQDVHRAGQVTESLESGRVDVDLLHVGGPAGLHVEGTTLHPTDGVLDGRVDVRGTTAGPDDPRGDVRLDGRVEVTAFEGTPLRGDERRQIGGELGEQAAAGWAQQQRLHPHRPAQGQFGGHTRPERGPDDMALLDAEFGQRPGHIVDMRVRGTRGHGRLTETPQVHPDDIPLQGQGRPLGLPHPPIGHTRMKQQDRDITPRADSVVDDALTSPRAGAGSPIIQRHGPPIPPPRLAPVVTAAGGRPSFTCLNDDTANSDATPWYNGHYSVSRPLSRSLLDRHIPQGLATWKNYYGSEKDLLVYTAYSQDGGRARIQGIDESDGSLTRYAQIRGGHAGSGLQESAG